MGGGLMQLVAYGAQDIYLTGNPQITFFKVVYRRHTNFACESIEQTINGSTSKGSKFSVTIARNGDLLSRVYIEADVSGGSKRDGFFSLLDYVEVEIGGQIIDKHYGEWMDIWVDLTHSIDKKLMLATMSGQDLGWNELINSTAWDASYGSCSTACSTACCDPCGSSKVVMPLQFWFCRNPGLALPLIALQYHEVKLNVQLSCCHKVDCVKVWCDYIFLDTDERRRFAQVSHEYLIEQVQFTNTISLGSQCSSQTELRFNHPVKELVWVVENASACSADCGPDYVEVCTALLQLNGHDRFRKRPGRHFTGTQRYEHHTGAALTTENVHVYSFALKPEEHQPSGTCNFSRIDNAVLLLDFSDTTGTGTGSRQLRVYATNYNVLRIMSGMGGLAYSN